MIERGGDAPDLRASAGHVDDYLWACLEDDEEHAIGHETRAELETVVQLACTRDGARGVWKCGDVRYAL